MKDKKIGENDKALTILKEITQMRKERDNLDDQISSKRKELEFICIHNLVENKETRYEKYCFHYKMCKTCGKQLF